MKNIFLMTACLLTMNGFSQKINNQLSFEKGKKLEMTLTVNSLSASMGNTTVDAVIERVFDIEDVINGNAVIEHKIKRIQFKMQSIMGAEDFDSEREQDRKGNMGKAFEKTLKSKYTMTIDAYGKILDVKKDDDNKAENNAATNDMIANILAQSGAGIKEPVAGEGSDFMILPAGESGSGDSWTDSLENGIGHYTIEAITDSTIVIQLNEEIQVNQKQEMMGNEINIITVEKSTGTILLDRKTKLLKEKNVTSTAEGTISAMGHTMPINTKTTKKWVVRG